MSTFDAHLNMDATMEDKVAEKVIPGMRVTLAHAVPHEEYTVVKISGKDVTRQHLADLGLSEGSKVTVKSFNKNNLIVDIKGVRVGIDFTLAERVTVLA